MILTIWDAHLVLFNQLNFKTINNSQIYLDNNATTKVDQRVVDEMLPFLTNNYFNPSSSYGSGKRIMQIVNNSRSLIAETLNVNPSEIFFTSGSTEAINIALKGFIHNDKIKGKHILTVKTEHSAVLETCKYLECLGFEVTYLEVLNDGLISLDELKKSIRPDTFLVSVMYVNNETGVIQPIKEISEIVHSHGAFFMCDTTQAIGKLKINVGDLNIDILCISGHKMYAPKGIGALFVSNNIRNLPLTPNSHGGKQESGLRSGTLNVPGIVALGKACEIAQTELFQNQIHISKLKNKLEIELLKIPNSKINGNFHNRIFNVSNICFKGIDANVLIGKLQKLSVSNGSACNSMIFQPSHVLTAMGLSEDEAMSSIRFSVGKFNTENEINEAIKIMTYNINLLTRYA
jgi:cysteine desulfurase